MRQSDKVGDQIFVDGNNAAALGCVYGGRHRGCRYPITLFVRAEAFQKYCEKYRVDPASGPSNFAIVRRGRTRLDRHG